MSTPKTGAEAIPPLAARPLTAPANGPLWGRRARDWSALQEPLVAPAYEAAFAHAGLGAGTRLLDVGCGSGFALQMAASRGAALAGIDASAALLEIARERLPEAELQAGEIEELPFASERFDIVSGFNSFQYAGNPVRALAEAKRVTRRGGQVLIVTWGRPEGMEAAQIITALRPLLPPPPPGAPGQFALSDETTLRAFAADAGLVVAEVFDTDTPWTYADLDTGLRALKSSGIAARAVDHSGEAAVDAAHAAVFAQFRQNDGSYRIKATFRCLLARVA
ncbi:MAG: class I SAM-dependent methyltransferase [Caldimonas sp.]